MWDGGPVDLFVQDCVWRLTEVRLCGVATLTGVSNETCLSVKPCRGDWMALKDYSDNEAVRPTKVGNRDLVLKNATFLWLGSVQKPHPPVCFSF